MTAPFRYYETEGLRLNEPIAEACPMTGRSASVCASDDHTLCPDLRKESGYDA